MQGLRFSHQCPEWSGLLGSSPLQDQDILVLCDPEEGGTAFLRKVAVIYQSTSRNLSEDLNLMKCDLR